MGFSGTTPAIRSANHYRPKIYRSHRGHIIQALCNAAFVQAQTGHGAEIYDRKGKTYMARRVEAEYPAPPIVSKGMWFGIGFC